MVAPWLGRHLGPVPVMIGGSIVSGLATFGVGVAILGITLLALPFVNRRTVEQALAAAEDGAT